MIDFKDIISLRESIQGRNAEQKRSAFIDNDLAIFDDVTNLSMPYEPRKVDMTIFGICLQGYATASVDSRKIEFKRNAYLVTMPGQTLQMQQMSDDLRAIFICISSKRSQEIINRLQDVVTLFMYIRQHPCIILDEKNVSWMQNLHGMLFEELNQSDNMFRRQTTETLLMSLYYKTCNVFGRQLADTPLRNSRQEDIFVQFIYALEQHFRERREVNYYAELLFVTPKYLSTVVKSVSGKSAGACIDSYVVEEAKMLLRTTRLSILEISQQLNFPNQSFFGKYFKRLTGNSPHQYRKTQTL